MTGFRVTIDGRVDEITRGAYRRGERAVTSAISGATTRAKTDWRGQVVSSGLGAKLSRAIRSKVYPEGQPSMTAAGLVWTKSPKIFEAHEMGVTIRARGRAFLSIPLPAAGAGPRGKRITPAEWERRHGVQLVPIRRPNGNLILFAEARISSRGLARRSRSKTGRSVASIPLFVLVPQVRLRKRLNLIAAGERIAAALPGQIVAAWRD